MIVLLRKESTYWQVISQLLQYSPLFSSTSCGSGSGQIGIILPDPDWDRHPGLNDPRSGSGDDFGSFKPNVQINYTLSRKFQYAFQNTENHNTGEKDKTDLKRFKQAL
jgi:hypothetical protein